MERRISLKGRGLIEGVAESKALVSNEPFGFWSGFDPKTGIVTNVRHNWKGQNLSEKVLVFPYFCGSIGGSAGVFLEAVRCGNAPSAIVVWEAETALVSGPLLARMFYQVDIPVVDRLNRDPIQLIKMGSRVKVDGKRGTIEFFSKELQRKKS